MKHIFRSTIVIMMVVITIGAALNSKALARVAIFIMGCAFVVASIKAFVDPEHFDWITPGWVPPDEEINQNTKVILLVNRLIAVCLLGFSVFNFYMFFWA